MYKLIKRSIIIALIFALAIPRLGIASGKNVGMDRPIEAVRIDIQRLTGCMIWKGDDQERGCVLKQTQASMDLINDQKDGTVETAEILALVRAAPRQPVAERSSEHMVTRIVQLLVPGWRQAPDWLATASDRIARGRTGSTITIGDLTILVRPVPVADVPGRLMLVVVTKQKSLDGWRFDN